MAVKHIFHEPINNPSILLEREREREREYHRWREDRL